MAERPFFRRPVGPVAGRAVEETGRRIAGAPDWPLVSAILALVLIGLVLLFSASFAVGQELYGDPRYFTLRQLAAAGLGLVAFTVLSQVDYRRWRGFSPLFLVLVLLGLLAVLIPGLGVEQNGARRWIQVGALPPLQPSEFAKLGVVLYVAAWLAARRDVLHQFTLGVVPFAIIVGVLCSLIVIEPDLGTAITMAVIAGSLFVLAGAAMRHILALLAAGGGVLFLIVGAVGYGQDRITQFLEAEANPETGGFQILQLLIALGSGGLTGVGVGESRQKFFYIPSAHTDGVFAVIGEETGFVGALVVLLVYVFIAYRGVRIAQRAPDQYGALLAIGVVTWIATQAAFNIGGITRTIPLTGIPLPFISYGGSALVAALAAAGLLTSVSRYATEAAPGSGAPQPTRRDYVDGLRRRGEEPT